jgi:2-desacetyl-2-hydroxyethyl bacteriochlorophyllide A dehydrogenase
MYFAAVVFETMPAAVYTGKGAVELQQVPVPPLGADDALIEVSHCGICGTDLHLVLEGYARPGSVLGHEWAGTIAAVGASVSGWEPGTRVVANPEPGCGECRACRRGRPSVCLRRAAPDYFSFRGAFCRYVSVPARRLLRLPDALTTRIAALAEPAAIAIHTVHLSGATPDDRVLVTGAGPVGLLTIAVLRAEGITDITVSEPSPLRRERALAVGAAHALEPFAVARAPMGRTVEAPFTIAFECSGNNFAAESAFDQLDYAGTLVFVGTGHDMPTINHNRAIVLELTIMGAYNYDADGFGSAVAMLAAGALPVDLLIDPVDAPLAGVLDAMLECARGERPAKVMVKP